MVVAVVAIRVTGFGGSRKGSQLRGRLPPAPGLPCDGPGVF